MPQANSPWIDQLKKNRPVLELSGNRQTQVVIVGAGIAGVTSAYFTLKNTDLDVILVEANLVAHGATGHNAGQIVSYFERTLTDLCGEYGAELTAQAQIDINSAWILIEEIFAETKITTPLSQFTGYAGCQDLTEIIVHLENIKFCREAKLEIEPLIVADDVGVHQLIPEKYYGLYTLAPQQDVLNLLETRDSNFIAVFSARKGCMNSALFCEDLVEYLIKHYSHRFTLFEHSPVHEVVLSERSALLKIKDKQIETERVVLCTNGFERFTITNTSGSDIDKQFHHLVNGVVGYMAAYEEPHQRSPIAISYLPDKTAKQNSIYSDIPYFYLTRRNFDTATGEDRSLICVGGPEALMDDTTNYQPTHPYPEEAQAKIDQFLHTTFKHAPTGTIEYKYKWHGLMGYTPNGLRCIGPEPRNQVLVYNLGCNGVGILPSVFGSSKIAKILNGEKLPKSLFDPLEHPENYKTSTIGLFNQLQDVMRQTFTGLATT